MHMGFQSPDHRKVLRQSVASVVYAEVLKGVLAHQLFFSIEIQKDSLLFEVPIIAELLAKVKGMPCAV